jgi:hypothetical protein
MESGYIMKKIILGALLGASALTAAHAGPVLIINGLSTTSEVGTTNSITTQLSTLHTAVGNVVTVVDSVPVDLTPYAQVWDIRFSNSSPITSPVETQYVSYLAGGGGMFVMGENGGFTTRNNSVLSLIAAAGGGSLAFTVPASTQTVFAPFTGPNAVSSVTFNAPGGVTSFGTGQWITSPGAGSGTGVAWGVGDLANATAGALTVIFDVNFMQTDAAASSQDLTKNLIGFVGNQVDPPVNNGVPEPATWAMMIGGFALVGASMRRRKVAVSFA